MALAYTLGPLVEPSWYRPAVASSPQTVATVAWVTPGGSDAPSAKARASLVAWAEARGMHLIPPLEAPVGTGVAGAVTGVDLALADTVEDDLQRGRDAIAAHDAPSAERALGAAEERLHAHPELPQAAWLLAEALRARAEAWRQLTPVDARRSADAWARAASLDGGRSAGLGEVGLSRAGAGAPGRTSVSLEGLPAGELGRLTVTVDGVAATGPLIFAAAGEHDVRVTRDGAVLWAAWVTFGREARVRVSLSGAAACSPDDLSRAHVADGRVEALGVTCADWVLAEEVGGAGELAVTSCNGDVCGPRLLWRVGTEGPVEPLRRSHGNRWPAWATWVIAGGGALAVTGVTLAAAGVFRPVRDEPVFTTGGLRTARAPLKIRLDLLGSGAVGAHAFSFGE